MSFNIYDKHTKKAGFEANIYFKLHNANSIVYTDIAFCVFLLVRYLHLRTMHKKHSINNFSHSPSTDHK